VTRHRTEHGRPSSRVADQADRQPRDEQHVAANEPRAGARSALELDLPVLDDDQPVVPLAVEVPSGLARSQDDDLAAAKGIDRQPSAA
jgi:hypothetical protein